MPDRMRIDQAVLDTILNSLTHGVRIVDHHRHIVHWNKAAQDITGFAAREVLDSTCGQTILAHLNEEGQALCDEACPLDATLTDGRDRSGHFYLRHKDGHRIPITTHITVLRDGTGTVTGAVEVFHETTSEAAAADRIRQLQQVASNCAATAGPSACSLSTWTTSNGSTTAGATPPGTGPSKSLPPPC